VALRRNVNSAAVRARLKPQRLAYGPTEIEKLDLYTTKAPNAPVMVSIHGGAWRNGTAKDNAENADLFVNAGAHLAVLDFISVDDAGGSLFPMVEQVRRGVAWVYKNAASFGGDPNRIFICGRSSGSHLGGTVLITDWVKDFGVPADVVKGALLSSGMYDLKPVRLSKRSKYVAFTDEMEEKLSTQRHLDRINCPVVLAHGTYETPEFQRQTREFAAAMKAAGKPVTLLIGEGYNHFEIPETMANPYGLLGRAVLELMGLPVVAR
jgi:arylformamidase